MATRGKFTRFANAASHFAGSPASFLLAIMVVVVWVVSGPIFAFSNTWQLVIKLDELIRATKGAHNALLDLEELEEGELQALQDRYEALAMRARESRSQNENDDDDDTGTPDIGR